MLFAIDTSIFAGIIAMNQTFTLPASLVNDIDMLKRNWGLDDIEEAIRHLLKLAVAREKKFLVA
jgi:hypothetical protein